LTQLGLEDKFRVRALPNTSTSESDLFRAIVRSPSDLKRLDGRSHGVTNHFPAIIHAGSELESLVIDELALPKAAFFLEG